MIVYKLCRIDKKGLLHPLFVGTDEIFYIGRPIYATDDHKRKGEKIFSKLGWLKYRPGLHLTLIPYAPHIGIKDENGIIRYMHDDTVWVECYIPDGLKNYTPEARKNGWRGGKFSAQRACLDYIPNNGWYWYTTNPNAKADWLISSQMTIIRILKDNEVTKKCAESDTIALVHRNNEYLKRIAA